MSCPLAVLELLYHDMTSALLPAQPCPSSPCHAHGRANYFVMNFDISAKKKKPTQINCSFSCHNCKTNKNWLKKNIPPLQSEGEPFPFKARPSSAQFQLQLQIARLMLPMILKFAPSIYLLPPSPLCTSFATLRLPSAQLRRKRQARLHAGVSARLACVFN